MALKSSLVLWSSLGDVNLNAAQAAAIGASLGNGAATFGANANNPLQMGDDGNLIVQTIAAGRNPAGTGSDYVVAVGSIPVGAFDIANRGINIMAAGSALNATSKTFKIIMGATAPAVGSIVSGGTTVAALGPVTTTSAGGWQLTANVFKYGAAGSNTQIAIHEAGQCGADLATLTAFSLLTLNESAAISVAVTINAATATDAIFAFLQVFGMN
jgi:hypothetical protein